jgi:hypothetical protein
MIIRRALAGGRDMQPRRDIGRKIDNQPHLRNQPSRRPVIPKGQLPGYARSRFLINHSRLGDSSLFYIRKDHLHFTQIRVKRVLFIRLWALQKCSIRFHGLGTPIALDGPGLCEIDLLVCLPVLECLLLELPGPRIRQRLANRMYRNEPPSGAIHILRLFL